MLSNSESQSALELLFLNDYASLVIVTAVVYDYILTFSKEIDYIWSKPWTQVSTLFFLVRYVGLCWIMTSALVPLFPALNKCKLLIDEYSILRSKMRIYIGSAMFLASLWTSAVLLCAADLVMILRVYAIWNCSRAVLFILLPIYALQIISTIIYFVICNNTRTHFLVTIIKILGFSSCSTSFNDTPTRHTLFLVAPRFLLGVALMFFAVFQALKRSLDLYSTTKCWELNRYMRMLMRDGVMYFFANMLYQIACMLNQKGTPPNNLTTLVSGTLIYILFYPFIPRLIIDIRELYARDVTPREIDTGFGILSQPNAASAIVFRGVDTVCQGPAVEDDKDDSDENSLGVV